MSGVLCLNRGANSTTCHYQSPTKTMPSCKINWVVGTTQSAMFVVLDHGTKTRTPRAALVKLEPCLAPSYPSFIQPGVLPLSFAHPSCDAKLASLGLSRNTIRHHQTRGVWTIRSISGLYPAVLCPLAQQNDGKEPPNILRGFILRSAVPLRLLFWMGNNQDRPTLECIDKPVVHCIRGVRVEGCTKLPYYS